MKIKATHWITRYQTRWDEEPEFRLYPFEMTGEWYVTVGTTEVEFEVPDSFDPRPAQIKALEEQRSKAMADYQALMNAIDGKIASLQAIEHKEAV